MASSSEDKPGGVTRLARFLRDDWRTFSARYGNVRRWFRGRYMYADPRTLGLTRILIGSLLVAECLRRGYYARDFYSSQGVNSTDWHLFSPDSEFNFSLFHAFSSVAEVRVAFGLACVCFFLFAIGYRTRLFNVLSLLWITSLDNRLVMIENGGYVVVNLITFWLCWLPTGRRYSVDSLRRAWRERRERSVDELNERWTPSWLTERHHSLASMIVIFNFGLIYVFNVVNKYGSTWREGNTLHFVLHLDRMITGIAAFAREVLPNWVLMGTTWFVLVIEGVIVMCIFWPRNRRWLRPLGIALIVVLHTGFGISMRLGPFSWFMIGWSSLLLMTVHWEALEAFYARRQPAITLRFDPRSGLAWTYARLVRRLDAADRLRFETREEGAWLEARVGEDAVTGRAAVWAGMRALLLGRYWLPVARLLSLGLLDVMVALVAARPEGLSRFFGLRPPEDDARRGTGEAEPSPLGLRLGRYRRRARELLVAFFMLGAVSQLINENKSIPKPIKHKQPYVMRMPIIAMRIFQGWGMFSPNPIRVDGVVTIDAVTIDGRHVDPLRGGEPDLNLSDDRGCGLGQIPQDYMNRIRKDRNKRHRTALGRWLRKYHERTGRPEDELVYYAVYWVQDVCPDPGFKEPEHLRTFCLLSWRKPGLRMAKGLPIPPRPCKVVSTGK